jgi:pyruvate dehydrogenase E1 component alpha subunit
VIATPFLRWSARSGGRGVAGMAGQGGVAAGGLAAAAKPALVRGSLPLSTGQEAVATGVCANLIREDLLTSTHRGHGHTLQADPDRVWSYT